MNEKMKHTPVPWWIGRPNDDENCVGIHADIDEMTWVLADLFTDGEPLTQELAEANASFIVQACNAHEELVEALKAAEEGLDMAINRFRKMGIMEEVVRYFPYLHKVEAALQRAGGTK